MLITELSDFSDLRAQWHELSSKDPTLAFIDPLLRDTCKLLNTNPTVTTVWSCQSHPENHPARGYVSLAVTDLQVIIDIYEEIYTLFPSMDDADHLDDSKHLLSLHIHKRYNPTIESWWNAVSLEWYTFDDVSVQFWIDLLHQATENVYSRSLQS